MAQHDDAPDGRPALPRVEIFKFNPARDCVVREPDICEACRRTVTLVSAFHEPYVCHECAEGWYWAAPAPIGLADDDACGPFSSPAEALEDAKRAADLALGNDDDEEIEAEP